MLKGCELTEDNHLQTQQPAQTLETRGLALCFPHTTLLRLLTEPTHNTDHGIPKQWPQSKDTLRVIMVMHRYLFPEHVCECECARARAHTHTSLCMDIQTCAHILAISAQDSGVKAHQRHYSPRSAPCIVAGGRAGIHTHPSSVMQPYRCKHTLAQLCRICNRLLRTPVAPPSPPHLLLRPQPCTAPNL